MLTGRTKFDASFRSVLLFPVPWWPLLMATYIAIVMYDFIVVRQLGYVASALISATAAAAMCGFKHMAILIFGPKKEAPRKPWWISSSAEIALSLLVFFGSGFAYLVLFIVFGLFPD